MESDDVEADIEDSIRSSITDLPEEWILEKLDGNALVFEIDGVEYPYIFLGDYYEEIRERIADIAVDAFFDRAVNTDGGEINKSLRDELRFTFNDAMAPRFARGRFLYYSPSPIPGVEFVNPEVKSKPDVDTDSDNAAIRMSNVEEYLIENSIINGLSDFSFDQLVFGKGDEKYTIPFDFMGDGFKAIVAVLWELSDPETHGDVLLLEEPETHMHPGYISELVHWLIDYSMDNGGQLFVTTHNIDFIRGFFSNNMYGNKISHLQDNFVLLQMEHETAQRLEYNEAANRLNELKLDLRGP